MAIQIPNAGTGNGQTGDNGYVLWQKTIDNFSDQTNAASRLVGTSNGNVPLITVDGIGGFDLGTVEDINNVNQNRYGVSSFKFLQTTANAPVTGGSYDAAGLQVSVNGQITQFLSLTHRDFRVRVNDDGTEWSEAVVYTDKSKVIYETTTALAANVAVDAGGALMRSTSSERYKDIISPLELDDESYADAMSLNPIVYRSKAEADNPNHHFYSFSAEALGAHDPAFTLWRDTETVTDDEGNVTEKPLDEREAEGINLNAIVAFLHATNVKQGKLIEELSARIGVLEEADLDK